MSAIPAYLRQSTSSHKICLILEGQEEEYYFKRLFELSVFSKGYSIKPINAKSASSIPGIFQMEYASNSYEAVLVVCDVDRHPEEFPKICAGIDSVLGPQKSSCVVFFTRPCTLQVILLHFGEVMLKTQAKKIAQPIVKELTGVENYDAHKEQLETICSKIYRRTYPEMKVRLQKISTNREDIPSSNLYFLFDNLESDDATWLNDIRDALSRDE